MSTSGEGREANRREFLLSVAPTGALACLGCGGLCRLLLGSRLPAQDSQHKFDADSQMSFQKVYSFAFAENLVPLLKSLGKEMPPGELVERLKRAGEDWGAEYGAIRRKEFPADDFAAVKNWFGERTRFWEHVQTWTVVEDTDSVFRMETTECLWAKTFRENDAADIGYATICHPDFAAVRAFNSKCRYERTTTLMQGHPRCDHRLVWEADAEDR